MAGPRLAIIADDLTGALDTAAPFAAVPGGVSVATRADALARALASAPGVVAVSTRSRDIPAGAARDLIATVLAQLPPGTRILKKVDSRLKGNVAAELSAIGGRLVILPAIPEFGRIVTSGAVRGFGVAEPIPVAGILGSEAERAAVPDVETARDMAAALATVPEDAALVGARGLALALAERWGLEPGGAAVLPAPCCFAVGSVDPITRAQVEELSRREGVTTVTAPGGRVPPARSAGIALVCTEPGGSVPESEVAAAFAGTILPWIEQARGTLLTGGATAEAVLDRLGVDCLRIDGEALPGMPLCRAGGRTYVTKSGGFGERDAFLRLAGLPLEV